MYTAWIRHGTQQLAAASAVLPGIFKWSNKETAEIEAKTLDAPTTHDIDNSDIRNSVTARKNTDSDADSSAIELGAIVEGTAISCSILGAKAALQNATTNIMYDYEVRKALEETRQLVEKHPDAPLPVLRGWFAEIHHKTSFNLSAIQNEVPFRAQVMQGSSAADVIIQNPNDARNMPVHEAQIKTGTERYINRTLSDPKYDGMQKVVPQGMENSSKGYDSSISYSGAFSEPISNEAAEAAVQNPDDHFKQMRPDTSVDIGAAALRGATRGMLWGGISTGTLLLAVKALQKKQVDREDVAITLEAGMLCGVAGAAAEVTSSVSGSVPAGGVATGAVVTAWHAGKHIRKGDMAAAKQEVIVGVVATTASVGAFVACSAISAAFPATLVLTPVAVGVASWGARKAASSIDVEQLKSYLSHTRSACSNLTHQPLYLGALLPRMQSLWQPLRHRAQHIHRRATPVVG